MANLFKYKYKKIHYAFIIIFIFILAFAIYAICTPFILFPFLKDSADAQPKITHQVVKNKETLEVDLQSNGDPTNGHEFPYYADSGSEYQMYFTFSGFSNEIDPSNVSNQFSIYFNSLYTKNHTLINTDYNVESFIDNFGFQQPIYSSSKLNYTLSVTSLFSAGKTFSFGDNLMSSFEYTYEFEAKFVLVSLIKDKNASCVFYVPIKVTFAQ